jgi:isopentenyl phosphate kinase
VQTAKNRDDGCRHVDGVTSVEHASMRASPLLLILTSLSASCATPPRDCAVVKLGGSALTSKANFETLNPEALAATAATIGELVRPGGVRLVLVHGAGSFGHHHAKAYKIQQGSAAHPEASLGFALTRSSVTRLNALVVQALIQVGVPAVGISPFPTWRTAGGKISADAMRCVERALDAGLVAVLHGDAVLDDEQGWAIVSGDELMVQAAAMLGPSRAVFLMDVRGVYDRPPSEAGAVLISRIQVDAHGRAHLPRTSVAAHDVTGGLERKLSSALRLAHGGVRTYLVQVGSRSAAQAMAGLPPDEGTLIVSEPEATEANLGGADAACTTDGAGQDFTS